MKLKAIQINGYLVLVDESAEIKEDSLFIDLETKEILTCHGFSGGKILPKAPVCNGVAYPNKEFIAIIIFAEKELDLDVPILPNWREWEMEKELDNYIETHWTNCNGYDTTDIEAIKITFRTLHKYNKTKYTGEDLVKAIAFGFGICRKENRAPFNLEQKEFIQSLQKVPKYILMESELEEPVIYGSNNNIVIPKLITNSESKKQEGVIKEIIY